MWLVILVILIILVLWYIHSRLVIKETYPFDKYERLKYYKECKWNKRECYKKFEGFQSQPTTYKNKEICIVTVSIGNRKFSQITKKRMQEYCNLHNYDFKYFTETIDDKYPVIWQKCLAMDQVLNMKNNKNHHRYKVVVWFDDDIYITNLKYRIEDFLQLNPNKDIFMARDIIKNNYNHYINSGNYIMKNTQISRDFMRDTLDGIHLFKGHFRIAVNHEQSINTYLYFAKKKYAKAIEVLPYGVLQSIYNKSYYWYNKFYWLVSQFLDLNGPWEDGDFCIHFISMNEEQRNKICKRIDSYSPKYKNTKKEWLISD